MAAAALPATTSLTASGGHVAVAALPAIERDLHLPAADAPGVITACTIPLAGPSTAAARAA